MPNRPKTRPKTKPKKPNTATLKGTDAELDEMLQTMEVQNWEVRHSSRGKTHLYIRCVPSVERPKLALA